MSPYFLFLAFFQSPSSISVPLLEDCSEPSRVIATLGTDDPVRVRSSIARAPKTCYAVTALLDGKPLNGYVLGAELRAIADFEKQRQEERAKPIIATPIPVTAAVPPPNDPAREPANPDSEKPRLPVFGDFSGKDLNGKSVSLSGVKGKVILVCFWSPQNTESLREATLVTRLTGQFRQQGVKGVAVGLTSDRELMGEAMEAIGVPDVYNGYAIAAKYGVTFRALPRTYILNENHEILASGLHGKELEDFVRNVAAER